MTATPLAPTMIAKELPAFRLAGVDGRIYEDTDFEQVVVVLVQACNHCPYVQAWEDRLRKISRSHEKKDVAVVALCSNDPLVSPEDTFELMVQRANQLGLEYIYLYDSDQSLARSLGATRTPEVFLFDRERSLKYHGAIDDNRDEAEVASHYLEDALNAVLAGRSPKIDDTSPVGCTVKWREDPAT